MTIDPFFIRVITSFCKLSSGPDAVQFIVNHATVEVIFCVPQTLSAVRFQYLTSTLN
jgi:hypothetical protein